MSATSIVFDGVVIQIETESINSEYDFVHYFEEHFEIEYFTKE